MDCTRVALIERVRPLLKRKITGVTMPPLKVVNPYKSLFETIRA